MELVPVRAIPAPITSSDRDGSGFDISAPITGELVQNSTSFDAKESVRSYKELSEKTTNGSKWVERLFKPYH
jgi:hypothetical protein